MSNDRADLRASNDSSVAASASGSSHALLQCLVIVAAILGTSDMWSLSIAPGQWWAALPMVAALSTVLLLASKDNTALQRTALGLLAASSIASIVYTATVQDAAEAEQEGASRRTTHYALQGLLLLGVVLHVTIIR